FDIAGDLQLPYTRIMVGQRHTANLGMVLRRNCDFEVRLNLVVQSPKLRLVGGKDDFVLVRFATERLVAGGPYPAGAQVAHITELSATVTGAILTPAGHVEMTTDASARAGVRHHHGVFAAG